MWRDIIKGIILLNFLRVLITSNNVQMNGKA